MGPWGRPMTSRSRSPLDCDGAILHIDILTSLGGAHSRTFLGCTAGMRARKRGELSKNLQQEGIDIL